MTTTDSLVTLEMKLVAVIRSLFIGLTLPKSAFGSDVRLGYDDKDLPHLCTPAWSVKAGATFAETEAIFKGPPSRFLAYDCSFSELIQSANRMTDAEYHELVANTVLNQLKQPRSPR